MEDICDALRVSSFYLRLVSSYEDQFCVQRVTSWLKDCPSNLSNADAIYQPAELVPPSVMMKSARGSPVCVYTGITPGGSKPSRPGTQLWRVSVFYCCSTWAHECYQDCRTEHGMKFYLQWKQFFQEPSEELSLITRPSKNNKSTIYSEINKTWD